MLIAACTESMKKISRMSQSEKTDVFSEVTSEGPVPAGFSDVLIKASIKTLEIVYSLESGESAQGKPDYIFLVNIDGQAVLWKVAGKKHELPLHVDGITNRDPEAGSGLKYVLEKKVRLAAGVHHVFFGLPEEPYYKVADISVTSGGTYVLEFKPKYWHSHLTTQTATFFEGILSYDVVFIESILR
jgi:hypothetical protein